MFVESMGEFTVARHPVWHVLPNGETRAEFEELAVRWPHYQVFCYRWRQGDASGERVVACLSSEDFKALLAEWSRMGSILGRVYEAVDCAGVP